MGKSPSRRKSVEFLPEGFKPDPIIADRYPDLLFAEKHARAAENLKKHGLLGKKKEKL